MLNTPNRSNLVRFGIQTTLVDERPDQTTVGRADGLQPKTLETLQMMRLGDRLLRVGTKVYDICMWSSGGTKKTLERTGREEHYPLDAVDVLEPYILLCHQGMVESLFVDDLRQRGVEVVRSTQFRACSSDDATGPLLVHCTEGGGEGKDKTFAADYLVGCDGAHSKVRSAIPGASASANGSGAATHHSVWGVLDGVVETDFPDIWSKTIVHSASLGSVLIIPRERGLTRFYIELKTSATAHALDQLGDQGEEYVMQRARSILQPYRLEWTSVEWFGRYQVAQRVANAFADAQHRVFIGGDASHAHSPKAAQGMNTSMHDSWNLAWKLNLVIRGLARPDVLLATYEAERKKIAHDLIAFDFEHANHIAGGDAQALAANFLTNVRFIAGVGVEYAPSVLNEHVPEAPAAPGGAVPGCNLPPAKATRYIDANRVDLQLDIPALGQFRVYLFVPDVVAAMASGFLSDLYDTVAQPTSLMSRLTTAAAASYAHKPRSRAKDDAYNCPERYTAVSHLFAFSLVTQAAKSSFEIDQLPPVLAASPWTVYLDDVAHLDTRGLSCTEKWLGGLQPGEAAIVNVRPDGYVGSVRRWGGSGGVAGAAEGREAAAWLDSYYGGFLQVPE